MNRTQEALETEVMLKDIATVLHFTEMLMTGQDKWLDDEHACNWYDVPELEVEETAEHELVLAVA